MPEIKGIFGPEPLREGEMPQAYIVGHQIGGSAMVCTRIEARTENFGDHGLLWFDVFADEALVSSMSGRHVAEVQYKVEQESGDA